MKIGKDSVVRLSVEMVDASGAPASAQEFEYLHGGSGNLFPKVEAALAGLEPGGKASVTLAPAEGFKLRREAGLRRPLRMRLDQPRQS
jgi:FKBP-type peptidyl-prolyl cis-trans isomerase SlyD